MATTNLFQLPTSPEQFSVLLSPAELRQLDFSALEFSTARRALIEYIKTYFPDDFNDFVSNNGIIMLTELIAYVTALLSLRGDILANEAFLPTATTENAVINHLALIDQKLRAATSAVVDIECTVQSPLSADIHIPAGGLFDVRGDDGRAIYYELYSAPNDLTSDIIIPAGKRGVIAFGCEGKTHTFRSSSDGKSNQVVKILDRGVMDDPVRVTITFGGIQNEWTKIDNIERAIATDEAFEVRLYNNELQIIFGDNVNGMVPPGGSDIQIVYRTGGGIRGRVGAGVIDVQRSVVPEYPYTVPTLVRFKNIQASVGGNDKETIGQAKKRAPRDFATHSTAITEFDYTQLSESFSHPSFGSVSKAIATVRTGLNTNLVEVYALAEGPNGIPVKPSEGLKRSLASYLDEINVITDTVEVKAGYIRPVSIRATVVMNKNADGSIVRGMVDDAISGFFALSEWDMGQSFYLARLYERINKIDGVSYVDIFEPLDNILPTGELRTDDTIDASGVAINEVITQGSKEISYYYESPR